MSVLVVGGGSFIGSHVTRRLLGRERTVVAYDVNVHDNAIHRILSPDEVARVKFVQGDVLDLVGLLHAARAHNVRDIVHLAAALIPTCHAEPALGVRVNVDGFDSRWHASWRRAAWSGQAPSPSTARKPATTASLTRMRRTGQRRCTARASP